MTFRPIIPLAAAALLGPTLAQTATADVTSDLTTDTTVKPRDNVQRHLNQVEQIAPSGRF